MFKKLTTALTAAVGLLLTGTAVPAHAAKANPHATSSGFIPPAAPSPSAAPDKDLPNLGRDKHGLPFYHPKQKNRVVRTTAYTHSESDHIAYGPKSAAGTYLKYTDEVRSAAADWSVYPLGTKFKIKGEPYTYIVDDYGSALVGTATIDIYHPSKALMRKWATRIVEIEVIEWGSPTRSMQQLAGRRGYKHCRSMYAALERQMQAAQNKG